jgi:hypothetical protein
MGLAASIYLDVLVWYACQIVGECHKHNATTSNKARTSMKFSLYLSQFGKTFHRLVSRHRWPWRGWQSKHMAYGATIWHHKTPHCKSTFFQAASLSAVPRQQVLWKGGLSAALVWADMAPPAGRQNSVTEIFAGAVLADQAFKPIFDSQRSRSGVAGDEVLQPLKM